MTEFIAGKKLDNLVAEKVMRWSWRDGYWMDSSSGPRSPLTPKFSTDIVAAWQVAEKYQLWVFPVYANDSVHWYAGKKSRWGENNDLPMGVIDMSFKCLERADTPMLAICKAALALVSPEERGVIGLTRGTSPT